MLTEFNGVSLTLRMLVLVRSFYHTADTNFSEEFLLHSFLLGVFLNNIFYPMLERNTHHDVFARSFCYSPRTGFSGGFLILSS